MITNKPIDHFNKMHLRVMCPRHGDSITLTIVDELTWECPLCQRGTCATCRHFEGREPGYNDSHRGLCDHLKIGVTRDFGCSLHQPTEQP